jgi:ribonucleoside-diphosphate reductase alpha chain
MPGPSLPFSQELHQSKYRTAGESFKEGQSRMCNHLKDNQEHFEQTREICLDMRFMAAGRVQASAGSTRNTTPWNCFVSGTIEDSFVEGNGSIMARATEAATTMRMGGGIGYDFSTLRPRGAMIKKLQSRSSGPMSFMGIFDAVCKCVASSGHRRGAQMGVLRVDHPDIEEFIHAKQNDSALTGFNISIALTDKFMECVKSGDPFPLTFAGEVHREVNAEALFDQIMRSTWDWAEPGVLFVDTINRMNNLWYCETIVATNPCGEQPLPPYGACLLGSFNLPKYIYALDDKTFAFDFALFKDDIPPIVRMMDNIIDRGNYPLYEQEKEGRNKRRQGLGITGLANAVEALGMPYGSKPFIEFEAKILEILRDETYNASMMLAAEKGAFPLFNAAKYAQGSFIKTLPQDIQKDIRQYGIRNSHLTSIAPTGTISLCADNVSSGIEPVFAYEFDRTVQTFDGPVTEKVSDYGMREFGIRGRRANDVTIDEHLAVLTEAQKYVDSAVSKTCNVPGDVKWDEFKSIYVRAWEEGAKGCTTFRTDGKRGGILTTTEDDEAEEGSACYVDPNTGRHECE